MSKASSVVQGDEAVVKGPGAPPSKITPSSALLVTGFVRPFRLPDAKGLFERHGNDHSPCFCFSPCGKTGVVANQKAVMDEFTNVAMSVGMSLYLLASLPYESKLLRLQWDAGKLKQFWMSGVRDKAYVVFETMEAAEAARQALYSLQWPEGMRTSLRPK